MTPPEWPAGIDYVKAIEAADRAVRLRYGGDYAGVAIAGVDAIAPLIAKAIEEAERPCEHCDRYNEDGATPMAWCACPDCWENLAGKWKEAETIAQRVTDALREVAYWSSESSARFGDVGAREFAAMALAANADAAHKARKATA